MIEFQAERPVYSDALILYAKETRDGEVYALTCDGIKATKADRSQLWPPFIQYGTPGDYGQSLFDALWRAGYRPHNGESSVAHVGAMKAHLEDMRTLVFKPSPRGDNGSVK